MKDFFKGMLVGSSMLVPGVSGGTMAMLLGVYDRLIESVASLNKRGLFFLLVFGAGGSIGAFLFARPLLNLVGLYEIPMLFFFTGCVCGGVPLMVERAGLRHMDLKSTLRAFIWVLLGAAVVFVMSMFGEGSVRDSNWGTWYTVIVGAILAFGLVLPGISVSYLMLILGIYQSTMSAIVELDFAFILPLAIGGIIGVLLTTRLVEWCLNKKTTQSYLLILGFILASILEIFPGFPTSTAQWVISLLLTIGGWFIIRALQRCFQD